MKDKYMFLLVIAILASTILQHSFLIISLQSSEEIPIIGKYTNVGIVSLCINPSGPYFINNTCPNQTSEGLDISCLFIANDTHTPVTLSSNFILGDTLFTINPNGSVFYQTYSGVPTNYTHLLGDYSVIITASDGTGCTNGEAYYQYDFTINDVNDPPYLSQTIPDQIISNGTLIKLFNLNNYFTDPEGEVMSFIHSSAPSILFQIQSDGDVFVFSSTCGSENLYFTATDPGSLSNDSNTLTIEVICASDPGDDGGDDDDGGSSGGGSGFSSCLSDWSCEAWQNCLPNGTQKRRCVDNKKCRSNYLEYYLYRNCTYWEQVDCEEEWSCDYWGKCTSSNTRSRTCMDLTACDSSKNKPQTEEECTYIPTCDDGIKNNGEKGVDCGGPCIPCKDLQIPGAFQDERTIISTIIAFGLFILMSLLLVYKYFYKQINTYVLKMLVSLSRKQKKRILLSEVDKKFLLEELLMVEKNLDGTVTNKKVVDIMVVSRNYFVRAFKIPLSFSLVMLKQYISDLKIDDPLDKILINFFEKTTSLETGNDKTAKFDLLLFIEELREVIHLTSKFHKNDIGKEIKELKLSSKDKDVTLIHKHLYNTYIAMHFNQYAIVKNKYSEIIRLYENLSEKKRGLLYGDLARLFHEIKYFLSVR